jgi:tetratricopeptide (TPR) repeat protein
MDKNHEKAMLDLQRLLKTQNFETPEEMEAFIQQNILGQKIPPFDKEALTPEEYAQDLVYQAQDCDDVIEADKLIYQALELDPECVEAFEYLGDMAGSPMASLIFFKNAFLLAEKKLGEKFFQENKGHFWGIHETRPYMRCLKSYTECLYTLGQKELALDIYFVLLELNLNDNQGVRDFAGLYSIELAQLDRFKKLHHDYAEDPTAFHFYNWALYLFVQQGNSEEARHALSAAKQQNKHVFHMLPSRKALPMLPEYFGIGDKNEAVTYCTFAQPIWKAQPGAIDWLTKSVFK